VKCANPACAQDIPEKALKKHKNQQFCCQDCFVAANVPRLKAGGHYQRFSRAGNAAQSAYKQVHGQVPGYENRARVLRERGKKHEAEQGRET
jgi:hypothetical protein